VDIHKAMVEPSGEPDAILRCIFRLWEVDLDETVTSEDANEIKCLPTSSMSSIFFISADTSSGGQ
jgi:hypothetical protein